MPALTEVVPPDIERLSPDDYVPTERIGSPMDLRDDAQLERLDSWPAHTDLFTILRSDRRINTWGLADRIHNGSYATPDGEVYAAMIADHKPR